MDAVEEVVAPPEGRGWPASTACPGLETPSRTAAAEPTEPPPTSGAELGSGFPGKIRCSWSGRTRWSEVSSFCPSVPFKGAMERGSVTGWSGAGSGSGSGAGEGAGAPGAVFPFPGGAPEKTSLGDLRPPEVAVGFGPLCRVRATGRCRETLLSSALRLSPEEDRSSPEAPIVSSSCVFSIAAVLVLAPERVGGLSSTMVAACSCGAKLDATESAGAASPPVLSRH